MPSAITMRAGATTTGAVAGKADGHVHDDQSVPAQAPDGHGRDRGRQEPRRGPARTAPRRRARPGRSRTTTLRQRAARDLAQRRHDGDPTARPATTDVHVRYDHPNLSGEHVVERRRMTGSDANPPVQRVGDLRSQVRAADDHHRRRGRQAGDRATTTTVASRRSSRPATSTRAGTGSPRTRRRSTSRTARCPTRRGPRRRLPAYAMATHRSNAPGEGSLPSDRCDDAEANAHRQLRRRPRSQHSGEEGHHARRRDGTTTAGMSVSGPTTFDARGRVYQQGQPTFCRRRPRPPRSCRST